ncbi:MAG: helix-turn-helix domain-containing protein [Acholeplasmatales bacterium]|nr:helix-turn-helix domain-containing protein [Acholeplasmatales bacterium]
MIFETTDEIIMDVAKRFKKMRKIKNITQQDLAKMSNVSYGTIKRFETTGEISLHSLTKLCVVLDCQDDIKALFKNISFNDIDEVIRYGKA